MSELSVRLGWWLSSEEHDPRALVAHARQAELAGFRTAMISDHLQPWVPHQANAPFVWAVIGAIAQATDELEVGTGVTAMVHRNHPVSVAHAAATAAVMLNGHFFLGVGSGERINEQPYGQRWPRAGERRDQLTEAIEVIRQVWSGQPAVHRGPYWSVENLRLATRPATPPPIYVAASGNLSAKTAGGVGDGLIGVSPEPKIVDVFRGSGGVAKRCLAQLHVSLATTMDQARDNAWEWWPNGVVPPNLLGELAKPEDFASISEAIGPDRIGDFVVCATDASPIIKAIDRYVGAGYDTVYLHQVGPDQSRLTDLAKDELFSHYRR